MTSPDASQRPERPWLWLAVRLGLGLGLLALALWFSRDQIAEVAARRPDLRLFALAFAFYFGGVLLAYLRWFLLVRAVGLPFTLRDAFRLGMIGTLFNLVIPGAIGGDFVKAAYLAREQTRKGQAIATIVIDRIVGLIGLFVLAAATGAWFWSRLDEDVQGVVIAAWIALGVTSLLAHPLLRPQPRRPPRPPPLAKAEGGEACGRVARCRARLPTPVRRHHPRQRDGRRDPPGQRPRLRRPRPRDVPVRPLVDGRPDDRAPRPLQHGDPLAVRRPRSVGGRQRPALPLGRLQGGRGDDARLPPAPVRRRRPRRDRLCRQPRSGPHADRRSRTPRRRRTRRRGPPTSSRHPAPADH